MILEVDRQLSLPRSARWRTPRAEITVTDTNGSTPHDSGRESLEMSIIDVARSATIQARSTTSDRYELKYKEGVNEHLDPPIPPAADRRRSLRAPLIVQRIRGDVGRTTFFGYARNISRGGLFISATSPRDEGSQFELEIPLPKPLDYTVRCACEVVWRRPWAKGLRMDPGMGLRFLDLPEDDAVAIDRWIEETARRERLLR